MKNMNSLEGVVFSVAFDNESKLVQFQIQDDSGKSVTCHYTYEDELPLKNGDRVQCIGNFTIKYMGGRNHNIFECNYLTARYEFDLLNFYMTYMPYASKETKSDMSNLTEFYRKITDRSYEYCKMTIGGISTDDLCKLFSSLYDCIKLDDENSLQDFSRYVFHNPNTKGLKHFLKIWNNDVLIRPLQLMGLTEKEIKSIHIPLHNAYEIVKTNPYRLPQYSISKATKIATSHLRLSSAPGPVNVNHKQLEYLSNEAIMCGILVRAVYDNIQKRKWTSTPVEKMKLIYPEYDTIKKKLEDFYFCVEEFEHVYFKPIYFMEKNVARNMSEMIKKPDREMYEPDECPEQSTSESSEKRTQKLRSPVYPGLIPSEMQQTAIKMGLKKYLSMITGGPGTGKTTIMSEIIRNINLNGEKVLCLSFTGAATTRIRATTMKAGVFEMCDIMTIHMTIAMQQKIKDIKVKYFIIDEISMVNMGLISEFISTYKILTNMQLILIGDVNQLEPIEYGNFMNQMLKTPIERIHLTENFRSQETIIKICEEIIDKNRVMCGKSVQWDKAANDYKFMIGGINFLEQLISYYANSFQIDNTLSMESNLELFSRYRDNFTIITPYTKVADEVNPIFQKYFMSYIKDFTDIGGTRFYLGDRVMKLINDYGINVMNGERGVVVKIHPSYIVCEFRKRKETLTPYIEKSKYSMMKEFVKKNDIKFKPYIIKEDGSKEDKTPEQIKSEIQQLKSIFLPSMGKIKQKVDNQTQEVYDNAITPFSTCTVADTSYNVPKMPQVETQASKREREMNEAMELYFHLLELYPQSMYNINEDAEFLNIKYLTLAYAITTHKSQGDQFEYVIYFLSGKRNMFVTINNIYTGMSRAKAHLDVVTESRDLIHSASLNKQQTVYDKLSHRINSLLPSEYFKKDEINGKEIIEEDEIPDVIDYEYDMDDSENFCFDFE